MVSAGLNVASEYFNRQSNKGMEEEQGELTLDIPVYPLTQCMGIISDLEMFEELVLPENKTVVVACFTKVKPLIELEFEYYLYQNESKNSVLVYSGTTRVCEFYIGDWTELNPEVTHFIEGLTD